MNTKIVITFLTFFFIPVLVNDGYAFDVKYNSQYKKALEITITEVMKGNWNRLKIVSLLKLCDEKELLSELFQEDVIGRDIKNNVQEDPLLKSDAEKWTMVSTAFVAGWEMGYANSKEIFIRENGSRDEVCELAIEQAGRL